MGNNFLLNLWHPVRVSDRRVALVYKMDIKIEKTDRAVLGKDEQNQSFDKIMIL